LRSLTLFTYCSFVFSAIPSPHRSSFEITSFWISDVPS